MSEPLTESQLREAHIRMTGEFPDKGHGLLTREQLEEKGVAQSVRCCAWCAGWFSLDWSPIARPERIQGGMISSGICPSCLSKIQTKYTTTP